MQEIELADYQWQMPKNETYEHFLLKNISRIYLAEKGCYYVGTEIYIYGTNNENSTKKVIDAVGVDKKQEISYGIEAKVSRSDFNNGYCSRCNYTYVICPINMIDKSELPSNIGLIYVDIENFRFITNAKEHRLQGVQLVKKARYNVNEYFVKPNGDVNEDMMFAHTQKLVERINHSNMNELIYNTNRVPMAKIVKGRRRWK